jgi:hypothetical protein
VQEDATQTFNRLTAEGGRADMHGATRPENRDAAKHLQKCIGAENRSRSRPPFETKRCPFAYAGRSEASMAMSLAYSGSSARRAETIAPRVASTKGLCARSFTAKR